MKSKNRLYQFLSARGPVIAVAAFSCLAANSASAQPDANNAGKADNPDNRAVGGGRGGNFGGGRGGFQMTPEQRQRMETEQAERREQMIRALLNRAGYTDAATVDPILAFVKEQDKAAAGIREQTNKLQQALRNEVTTEAQTATLLNDLHAAADTEKERRVTATKALDGKISFTKKPKLEAILTVLGIIGDEASLASTGTVLGGGMGGFGGRGGGMGGFGGGGFGGGMGGPGGGRGGDRGGNGAGGGDRGGRGGNRGGGGNAPAPAPANELAF